MQFVVLGHFNNRFNEMSPEQQSEGSHAEWAKSREYYAQATCAASGSTRRTRA